MGAESALGGLNGGLLVITQPIDSSITYPLASSALECLSRSMLDLLILPTASCRILDGVAIKMAMISYSITKCGLCFLLSCGTCVC